MTAVRRRASYILPFASGVTEGFRAFSRDVVSTFSTRLLLLCCALAVTVIVSRALGPTGRGFYAVAVTVSAVGVQVGNLGLHASNTYFIARDRTLLPSLLGNALFASFLFGGLGAGLCWLFFLRWPSTAPLGGALLLWTLLSIPISLAYLLLQNLLLGILEVSLFNRIEMATKVLGLAILLVAYALHVLTVDLAFLAGPFGMFIGLVFLFIYLLRQASRPMQISLSLFKDNLDIGLRAYLVAIFSFLVLRADLLMVRFLLDATETGYYSIAAVMADTILIAPAAVAAILFPKLSGMRDESHRREFAKKAVVLTGLVMIPVVLLCVLLARPVVMLFFGKSFLPSVSAFLWLMPGIFFLSVETVMVQLLNSMGFPKLVVAGWAMCCCLNVGMNLWVIPRYGIVGAAAVSSACYILISLLVTSVWLNVNRVTADVLEEKAIVSA